MKWIQPSLNVLNFIVKILRKVIQRKLAKKCSRAFSLFSTLKKCSINLKKDARKKNLEELQKSKSNTKKKSNLKKEI